MSSNSARLTDAPWWDGDPGRTPVKQYKDGVRTSFYIPMSDGTRIAVDLYLPKDLPAGERIPSILTITPYFRSIEFRSKFIDEKVAKRNRVLGRLEPIEFAQYGYAYVWMDMRGAGASYGKKRSMMMVDVVRDGPEVLDWIVAQPWSNGKVGGTGISGLGMTALWLATTKHSALGAIAPRFTVFDIYRAIHANGLLCSRFLDDIGKKLRAMDDNRLAEAAETLLARLGLRALFKGIRPVDEDKDRSMLADAVSEHAGNQAFDLDIVAARHRDTPLPVAGGGATLDTQAPATFGSDLEAAGIPIYAYSGWFDAAFNREMMSLFNTVRNPGSRLIIGPWAHGGSFYNSLVVRGKRKSEFPQTAELVRFFDRHLRDEDLSSKEEDEAPVHYFTMAEERWKAANSWPPPGVSRRSYFLHQGGLLSDETPATEGSDSYRVDFSAGIGVWSRFGKSNSGGLKPARYPKRAEKDKRLLTYTSPPLPQDLEVTGHPLVRLFLRCSTSDAGIFVYLEDVAGDGEVTNVTEGCMRLSHRNVTNEPPPFWHPGPWHRGKVDDVQVGEPGSILEVEYDLIPVSWLFRKGHAIRLAIAGADRDNFVRVPEDDVPTFTVLRGGIRASQIELPVMDRDARS
jgi:putative CocE/NonD family hydrolase